MSQTFALQTTRRGPALDALCRRYRSAMAQASASEALAQLAACRAEEDASWGWALGHWSRQALRWRRMEDRLERRLLVRMGAPAGLPAPLTKTSAGRPRRAGVRVRHAVVARLLPVLG